MSSNNFGFYTFDKDMVTQIRNIVFQKHYPHRIPPDKWPDKELIGKAMVRGWAVPCRYYPRPWRHSSYIRSFVYPGITDAEMNHIHALVSRRNNA